VKPAPFHYHSPRSKADALHLLATHDDARLLAGGQSLMPMLNFRLATPAHVIDINRVPELAGISVNHDVLTIGAMTRQCDVLASALVRKHAPLLTNALSHVGHQQTRNRGTIGGSLCHLDPSAELVTAAMTMDATLAVESTNGSRRLPMRDWVKGYLATALDMGEMLTRIEFPLWPATHRHAFVEYARRKGDFAIVGVAVLLEVNAHNTITRAALAIGGCAAAPQRPAAVEHALLGQPANAATFKAAARFVSSIEALSDAHVTAEYRLHLARVLTERALLQAMAP
jgi:carbon-monoxide dehydrogenase medium subunit